MTVVKFPKQARSSVAADTAPLVDVPYGGPTSQAFENELRRSSAAVATREADAQIRQLTAETANIMLRAQNLARYHNRRGQIIKIAEAALAALKAELS
jgi:hypothetical protein